MDTLEIDIVVQTIEADENTQYTSSRKDAIHKNETLLDFYISKTTFKGIKPDQVV